VSDRIVLHGLQAHGYHGVHDHERRNGQLFVVDATLAVDTRAAARSDDLADTVDYSSLARELCEVVEGEPVSLLETLAGRLVAVCLADPRVDAVDITVHKPQAPVGVPVDDITVTIHRDRSG